MKALSEGLIFELGLMPYSPFDPEWPEYWYPAIWNCTIRTSEHDSETVEIYCRWGCLFSRIYWPKYMLTNRAFMATLPKTLAENFTDIIANEITVKQLPC